MQTQFSAARSGSVQDATAAVAAVDLVKVYGSGDTAVRALDGVTVGFTRAEFTAIMGPSGSGKSTLMHCLAGLDTATSGQALLGGTDLTRQSDRVLTKVRRERIGFVFQAFNLLPQLTAEQNILLPMELAGRTRTCSPTSPRCWASPAGSATARPSSPAASSSASRWPAHWSAAPRWSSPTSRPATWTCSPTAGSPSFVVYATVLSQQIAERSLLASLSGTPAGVDLVLRDGDEMTTDLAGAIGKLPEVAEVAEVAARADARDYAAWRREPLARRPEPVGLHASTERASNRRALSARRAGSSRRMSWQPTASKCCRPCRPASARADPVGCPGAAGERTARRPDNSRRGRPIGRI